MTLNTHPVDRKAMVQAISELLETPAVYQFTPTYAFAIGPVTVNRDGTTSCDDDSILERVTAMLIERGWLEAPATPSPISEPEESNEDDIETLCLTIPEHDWSIPTLTNFLHLMYARQDLISKMLRIDTLRIDDVFIEQIASAEILSVENLEDLVHEATENDSITGLDIQDGAVTIELPFDPDSKAWQTCAQLLKACISAAKLSKRILPRKPEGAPDKYQANAWLVRLGFGGTDFKEFRHDLMAHLPGFAAFKDEGRMQAHKDKLAEQRRLKKEQHEEVHSDD